MGCKVFLDDLSCVKVAPGGVVLELFVGGVDENIGHLVHDEILGGGGDGGGEGLCSWRGLEESERGGH